MTWLLRLFPQFRSLESELQAQSVRATSLQDRLNEEVGRNAELTKRCATQDAQLSLAHMVDYLSQLYTGRRVYGVGPDVQKEVPVIEGSSRPMSGRSMQQQLTEDFFRSEDERMIAAINDIPQQ